MGEGLGMGVTTELASVRGFNRRINPTPAPPPSRGREEFLDIPANVRRRAWRAGDVDAALGLFLALPAARAPVFRRLGAGPAADRGVTLGDQRMGGQFVLG